MKIIAVRRAVTGLLTLSLAIPGLSAPQSNQEPIHEISQTDSTAPGVHDFDFLVGHWRVQHRKLKVRLANNHEWMEFEGTLYSQPLMGATAMSTTSNSMCRALPIVGSRYAPSTRSLSNG
jgi:hypothetical protein